MAKKPGRKPVPSNVVALRGNPSKLSKAELERREAEEVRPRPVRPKAPPELSPYARECWDQHAAELETLGLLTALDGGSFRLLCETFALALEALDELRPRKQDGTPDLRKKRHELIVHDRRGEPRRNPALVVFFQASKEYRALCGDFGLTPSSRVGLRPAALAPSYSEGSSDGEDDDAAFFG